MKIDIYDSFDLLFFLKSKNLLADCKDEFWWENSGTLEVVIGAILVQNTKWHQVKKAILSLKKYDLITLESLANIDLRLLESLIQNCGFYHQKAIRLKLLATNIISEFGDFDNFKNNASRQWLLSQKGIGFESADSILNYAFYREVMVVDKYTQKLLYTLGFEFDDYDALQDWLTRGVVDNYERIENLYYKEIPLSKVYARFHAKIVEFSKKPSHFST